MSDTVKPPQPQESKYAGDIDFRAQFMNAWQKLQRVGVQPLIYKDSGLPDDDEPFGAKDGSLLFEVEFEPDETIISPDAKRPFRAVLIFWTEHGLSDTPMATIYYSPFLKGDTGVSVTHGDNKEVLRSRKVSVEAEIYPDNRMKKEEEHWDYTDDTGVHSEGQVQEQPYEDDVYKHSVAQVLACVHEGNFVPIDLTNEQEFLSSHAKINAFMSKNWITPEDTQDTPSLAG